MGVVISVFVDIVGLECIKGVREIKVRGDGVFAESRNKMSAAEQCLSMNNSEHAGAVVIEIGLDEPQARRGVKFLANGGEPFDDSAWHILGLLRQRKAPVDAQREELDATWKLLKPRAVSSLPMKTQS